MSTSERRFQAYDIFKLIVTIILIILILWQWRTSSGLTGTPGPGSTAEGGATAIAAEPSPAPATAPPTLAVPTVEAVVGADGVALSGTGTPGSRVQITIDGQAAGQADVDASGHWTFSLAAAPGAHTIVVQALDAAGSEAATAPPLTLTVPAPIDAPTLDSLPANAAPGALALRGTGTPRSTVQIVIDGQVAGQVAVSANGRWSFATSIPTAGEHTVRVDALDEAGQVVASAPPATLQLTARPTATPTPTPAATTAAPTLDALPADAAPGALAFSGTGTPGAMVQIVIDGQVAGQARVGSDGRWSFPAEIAAAGEHRVQVNALDAAGQVAASAPPATLQLAAAPTPTPRPATPTARPGSASDCNPNDPTAYGEDLGQTWRVERCDTLSYISRQTGVDLNLLIAANPQIQNPNLIFPGQIVTLPGR